METLKIELGERVTAYLAGIGNPRDRYYVATWMVEDWRFGIFHPSELNRIAEASWKLATSGVAS